MKHILKLLVYTVLLCSSLNSQGTVILLNGTSSAGKSSIIEEFQKLTSNSYEVVVHNRAFDGKNWRFPREIIISFLGKTLERPLTQKEIEWIKTEDERRLKIALTTPNKQKEKNCHGAELYLPLKGEFVNFYFEQVAKEMSRRAVALAKQNKNVVIDTPLVKNNHGKCILEGLKGLDNIVFINVYCPFLTLVERVRSRNELAEVSQEKEGKRRFSVAFVQFAQIYKEQENGDFIPEPFQKKILTRKEVDEAWELTRDEFKENPSEWIKYKLEILEKLNLKNNISVKITPRFKNDFFVNTGILSPQESAQKIKQFMETKSVLTAFKLE